jgi:aminoglycoside/choline kinase family phosphotransferase
VVELPPAVSRYLARTADAGARAVPLSGDASDRRYFRVGRPGGATYVLAVYGAAFDPASQPFVSAAALFARMPVAVPRVLDVAGDLGVIALEDLGDVTLQAHLDSASDDERRARYAEAVALIEVVQRRGRELADPGLLAYRTVFDAGKLTWELDYFRTHFLEGYRGATLSPSERQAVDDAFGRIADALAAEPRVLCHRDFHSRNLMVRDGALAMIDFQDARLGPDTYDLVSLLRDAYVELPEADVGELIEVFRRGAGLEDTPETFRARFDLMALQRTLKALGTFGYQTTVRGTPVYVRYMPRALGHARAALRTVPGMDRLTRVLAAHVPELG